MMVLHKNEEEETPLFTLNVQRVEGNTFELLQDVEINGILYEKGTVVEFGIDDEE